MSHAEFMAWAAYCELYGPLDYRRRYDHPAALIAWTAQAAQGGKAELDAFLPRFDGDAPAIDRNIKRAFGVTD